MIQYKLRLSSDFESILKDCEEVWIAAAMISNSGFAYIQKHINKSAKQNYLVGIGLPTSPEVLENLKILEGNELFSSRIYHKNDRLFHPKVYIFKNGEKITVFVGSGNCTKGGFDKNVEVSIKTDEKEVCENLIKWFTTSFKLSKEITDDFLDSYRIIFKNRSARMKEEAQELQVLFPDHQNGSTLDKMDFTKHFFKKEHYKAFEGTKPWNTSDHINTERERVRSLMFKLNDKLAPILKNKNWDLSPHYHFEDIVSSAVHGPRTSPELRAIWLHYGRDKKEIKNYGENQTPLDYMRMQVIIHKDNFGIWNRIGKSNGSKIDRQNLKDKLMTDVIYRKKMFEAVMNLPDEYYISLNNDTKYISEIYDEQQMIDYLLQDDYKYYFTIGMNLSPDDPRLTEENILSTITENFELLLPTYQLIKHELLF
jgi:HKD family nuclease